METYEKRYNEAQKWIESIYTELSHERQMEAEAFFPELKERKRGDTREKLISFLEYLSKIVNDSILGKWTKTDCVKWIDWVKKQDPKKFEEELEKAYKCADEVQYRKGYEDAKREILGMVDIESITESYKQKLLSQCNSVNRPVFRISVEAFKHGAKTILDELYLKQSEQKPTDKVEPKFKVGDFIVNDYCIGRIVEITNDAYLLDTKQGIPFSCHGTHLWDITKDAKDGDVLYSLDSKQPFIFKHRKPHEQAAVYCGINIYGKFFVENTNDCIITADKYIPADKFQRDLLFQKMKEAGYEWDDEKRELRNIGKTSSNWSEVDNVRLDEAIQMVESNGTWVRSDDAVKLVSDWLKFLKEKLTETKGGEI